MRSYWIFNIKKQYQSFIFGRERMLLEMVSTLDDKFVSSVTKELSYICEPIVGSQVHEVILEHLQRSFPEMRKNGEYLKFEHHLKGSIKLKVNDYHIEAICEGSRMLDLDLFQSLSQMNDSFLAFNKAEAECGWLKPIKHASF